MILEICIPSQKIMILKYDTVSFTWIEKQEQDLFVFTGKNDSDMHLS